MTSTPTAQLTRRLTALVASWSMAPVFLLFALYRWILFRDITDFPGIIYLIIGLISIAVIYGVTPSALRRLDAAPRSIRKRRIGLGVAALHVVMMVIVVVTFAAFFNQTAEPIDWVIIRMGVPYLAISLPVTAIVMVQLAIRADKRLWEQQRARSEQYRAEHYRPTQPSTVRTTR